MKRISYSLPFNRLGVARGLVFYLLFAAKAATLSAATALFLLLLFMPFTGSFTLWLAVTPVLVLGLTAGVSSSAFKLRRKTKYRRKKINEIVIPISDLPKMARMPFDTQEDIAKTVVKELFKQGGIKTEIPEVFKYQKKSGPSSGMPHTSKLWQAIVDYHYRGDATARNPELKRQDFYLQEIEAALREIGIQDIELDSTLGQWQRSEDEDQVIKRYLRMKNILDKDPIFSEIARKLFP